MIIKDEYTLNADLNNVPMDELIKIKNLIIEEIEKRYIDFRHVENLIYSLNEEGTNDLTLLIQKYPKNKNNENIENNIARHLCKFLNESNLKFIKELNK